jgi:hypothetical protein
VIEVPNATVNEVDLGSASKLALDMATGIADMQVQPKLDRSRARAVAKNDGRRRADGDFPLVVNSCRLSTLIRRTNVSRQRWRNTLRCGVRAVLPLEPYSVTASAPVNVRYYTYLLASALAHTFSLTLFYASRHYAVYFVRGGETNKTGWMDRRRRSCGTSVVCMSLEPRCTPHGESTINSGDAQGVRVIRDRLYFSLAHRTRYFGTFKSILNQLLTSW